MVNCPNCGKVLVEADRKIETSMFRVELYTCDCCGKKFKVAT